MEEASGSEQPGAESRCPYCGAALDDSARCCPSRGHSLTDAPGGVDISGWVKAGWEMFLRDIPNAIAIPLILIIPTVGLFGFGYFGFVGMMIMLSEHKSGASHVVAMVIGALLGTLFLICALAVPALQGGVFACFLQGIRTGRLAADSLWAGFRHWWACTWVIWLLSGAVVLCLPLVFILVGIPLLVGLFTLHWLSLFRIVDTGSGGMEALSFAWRTLRARLWVMLVYSLVIFTLMNAGVAAMYLGMLVTVPIGYAALAAGYDSLRREREQVPAA